MSLLIRPPTPRDFAQMSELLCRDAVLRDDLGLAPAEMPTPQGCKSHLRDWCRTRQATIYVIVREGMVVGTISLSHVSQDGKSARIGYWVGSAHRRKGYCKEAFRQVLEIARAGGIDQVQARIDQTNTASRRIWEALGARPCPAGETKLDYVLGTASPAIP